MKSKTLTALFSIVVAFALWLYVVTMVSPNSDKKFNDVPVTLQGVTLLQDRGLMITSSDLQTVDLHLEGNRSDLDKLSSANITINVDVSRIYEAGTHYLTFTPTYPGDVSNNAINVLSRDPSTIMVVVEERISKSVPVELVYSGTLSEGFMADKENIELDAEDVHIVGPKSVTDRITMARLDVDLEARSESISGLFPYTLCDANGEAVDVEQVTTDLEGINVTLKIHRVTDLPLAVDVISGGGATEQTSSITIEPATIQISGSDSLLEGLDKLVLGTVNLGEMTGDQTLTFPIKLPEGISNETGVTEAKVEVRFPDLGTKTLAVENINAINVPQGMDASLITKQLEITVRGPKDAVESITADAVTVTVDFSEEQLGTATVKAQIAIDHAEVGTVGTYNVTATLKKKR